MVEGWKTGGSSGDEAKIKSRRHLTPRRSGIYAPISAGGCALILPLVRNPTSVLLY